MKVLITGIGDAFTARHFGSSALIAAPDGHVLLDCPDPIHRVLREATEAAGWSADVTTIHDIIITHLHGDHCNGLESFAFKRRVLKMSDNDVSRPRLHVTPPVAERVWEKLAPAMDAPMGGRRSTLDTYFRLRTFSPDAPTEIAGLVVRSRFTRHPIPTVGVLVSDGEVTLGWSSDTPFEQEHVDFLSEADLIVHECNRGAAHTHIEELNALPDELRRRMRLIHLPDDFDPSSTDMSPVRQGEVLEVTAASCA